jgi:D-alanyl-D-alanine carboxypeptidase/D-alanyl-D-alanine-endopeptidase (penicillin-binding protein 4)
MELRYLCWVLWYLLTINQFAYAADAPSSAHPAQLHQKHHHHHKHQTPKKHSPPAVQPPLTLGQNQLTRALDHLVRANSGGADIAVYVKSMRRGDTLYAYRIHQPLTPASTLKLFTAEAAFLFLGPQYRFATQLLTDTSMVQNGILQGNLYVMLSGDPTFTYDDLVELLSILQAKHIRGIAGHVYIDNTAYDQRFYGPGWTWKDRSFCYAAPISASIINHNCFSLRMTPAKRQTRFFQGCTPHISSESNNLLSIVDDCRSKSADNFGTSPVVKDIAEYNRFLLKNAFNQLGITVYGSMVLGSTPRESSLINRHDSEPLTVLVSEMLKKSDNVIAGALFKKMGQLYTRKQGSWESGRLAVSRILQEKTSLNLSGIKILDGSGLSPENQATPTQMMQALDFAYHHALLHDALMDALPVAGVDGTLKHRMQHIARKVRAKTGTISGVVTLAGFAETKDKEPLAFVIMINGHKGWSWRYRSLEDKIATILTQYRRS